MIRCVDHCFMGKLSGIMLSSLWCISYLVQEVLVLAH